MDSNVKMAWKKNSKGGSTAGENTHPTKVVAPVKRFGRTVHPRSENRFFFRETPGVQCRASSTPGPGS